MKRECNRSQFNPWEIFPSFWRKQCKLPWPDVLIIKIYAKMPTSFVFFTDLLILSRYIYLPACMFVYHVHVCCPHMQEENVKPSGNCGVRDICELSCKCWSPY